MSRTESTVTRRTALQAIGTVGGVALAGVASAGHLEEGDCAVTTAEVWMYEQACPAENYQQTVEEGTYGQVFDLCTNSDGEEWAYFSPDSTFIPAGWVRARYLEKC